MNVGSPLVTIAIPTFNRAHYIAETVESALNQTYENIEIIISDNCSTDNTEEIVKQFKEGKIRYYRQNTNIGMVGNWNFCLQQATGDFFLLLSDDDLLEKEAIERLLSQFNDTSITLAYSRVTYIDEYSNSIGKSLAAPCLESGHEFIINSLKRKREVYPAATIHRTETAKRLGGYLDIGSATDLALRLSLAVGGTVAFLPEQLVKYRIHRHRISSSFDKVISSHEALANWAGEPKCLLKPYEKNIKEYCSHVVYFMTISAMMRGQKKAASTALTAARKLRFNWSFEVLICLANLGVLKVLRQILSRIAVVSRNKLNN
ncbi:glycosyltransferase family 2 protein [Moorella naiadis]|uniref:glycosyltransferase family 2 protein n=1 Tax=Moorella naiadis (nom. illeg.) TaxID=3093670 RepID=UPI003D9CBD2D